MNKKKRLLEIIKELQTMYPKLDRLMLTDIDDPDSIIITSEDKLGEIAKDLGLDTTGIEELEDISEKDLDELAQLTFDDIKGNGGGFFQ